MIGICLTEIANILCIPTLLFFFKLKGKIHKMTEEKWNEYFENMSLQKYKKWIYVIGIIPVTIISICSYIFSHSIFIVCMIFFVGILCTLYKLKKNFPIIIDKITALKSSL